MIVDERFYRPRTPVAVVAIGEASEALLVRSALESLGAAVLLHLIGTPEDFLRVIGQGETAPHYIVICGHGGETGLVFGEYGEGIDVAALERGSMPPAAIAGRVKLPGRIVISTACETGSKAFGEAFLTGGVAAYIAPDGSADGADAALFVHLLFHQILRKGPRPVRRFAMHRNMTARSGYSLTSQVPAPSKTAVRLCEAPMAKRGGKARVDRWLSFAVWFCQKLLEARREAEAGNGLALGNDPTILSHKLVRILRIPAAARGNY